MSGEVARRIFEKSGLGIETLGRIWQLADTEQRGALVQTEFVIAMHLLTSTKMGTLRALPAMLPAGLYEAATRGVAAASSGPGASIGVAVGSPASPVARQQSPLGGGFGAGGILPPPPTASISRQLTGHMRPAPPNFSNSPLGRTAAPAAAPNAGPEWLITPAEKARMDPVFQSLDKTHKGFITGEEAVPFLTRSGLDEDTLAQIWDLADVNSEGHLTSDTFAVALYLIQQQRQRTDGTSGLPAKLPANLVPPSLRSKAAGTTSPPPAVAPTPPPPQPKSAMDDLFGLDSGASSTPSLPALAATPAGVSAATAGLSDPFATSSSPVQPSSPTRSPTVNTTSFKPFVPSSSFGRSLTAQATGDSNSSAPSSSAARSAPALSQQPSAVQHAPLSVSTSSASAAQNDLLGGDDGEASRNLSNDTAELANLSNQIGSLSRHMQDTTTHRSTLQAELSQTSTQKKNFEQRLAQLRTLYEKEARDVRALEEQLKTSRSDTKTLQTQLATLEASFNDLQTQHQTISTALQADQQENGSLKERIKVVSAEVNQLKPQIEKLKSEARQQKGIVAINRKQLSLGESEREKLKTEADDLTRQNQDLARQIHNASVSSAASSGASPSVASASGKNPFFRRTGSSDIMGVFSSPTQGLSPSLSSVAAARPLGEKSFDDVFGPGPAASSAAAATPVIPAASAAVAAIKPQFTGASTGSSSFSAVTAPTSEAATPSISRQGTDITPTAAAEPASHQTSFSPFPATVTSPPPPAEAAVAAPPAPAEVSSPAASVTSPVERASATASPAPAAAPREVPASSTPAPEAQTSSSSVFSGFGPTATAAAVVTAATAGVAAVASNTGDAASPAADADKGKSVWSQGHGQNDSLSDPFTVLDQQQDKAKEDFESAFASFKAARAAEPDDDAFEVKPPASAAAAPSTSFVAPKEEEPVNTDTSKAFANFHSEFPPISELNHDEDESDSDTDGGGFDDDFAPASPKNNQIQKAPETTPAPAAAIPEATNGEPAVPKAASPVLAKSAPAESDIFSSPATVTPDVFSAPAPITSVDDIFSAPAASAPEPTPAATAAPVVAPAAVPDTTASEDAFDELDDDFEGLEDAREGSADDDFANVNRSTLDDFQSAFDSSPTGKLDSRTSFGVDSSFDFSTLGASSTSAGTAAASQNVNGAKASAAADTGDWFSFATGDAEPAAAEAAPAAAEFSPSAATEDAARPATLNRLDTQESTTHDDPILRQLTSMGYTRSVALNALEKYDYNVDRVSQVRRGGTA